MVLIEVGRRDLRASDLSDSRQQPFRVERLVKDVSYVSGRCMDANYCREKAALCARLADTLPPNNSGRIGLLEMADDFRRRAIALEARPVQQQRQPQTANDL
jgi:hypothetical protein